jgi:hypothetical protein
MDEYLKWMLLDSMKYAAYAAIVFSVGIGSYWLYEFLT